MIVDVECIPHPLGRDGQPYAHVDAAIAVAQASGLRHEVHAFGTTVEGPPDRLWALVREMHEASLASGAAQVVTVVKVAQHADGVAQPTIDGLTGKFRP